MAPLLKILPSSRAGIFSAGGALLGFLVALWWWQGDEAREKVIYLEVEIAPEVTSTGRVFYDRGRGWRMLHEQKIYRSSWPSTYRYPLERKHRGVLRWHPALLAGEFHLGRIGWVNGWGVSVAEVPAESWQLHQIRGLKKTARGWSFAIARGAERDSYFTIPIPSAAAIAQSQGGLLWRRLAVALGWIVGGALLGWLMIALPRPWRVILTPRGFAVAGALGVVAFGGVYGGIYYWQMGAPLAAEYWLRDARAAKIAQARACTVPKAIVVGGSSGFFGIDSPVLAQAAQRPVYNLATHAGLTLDVHLQAVREVWQPGDWVIFHLEPGYWRTTSRFSSWTCHQVLTWFRPYWHQLNWRERVDFTTKVALGRVAAGVVAQWFAPSLYHRYPHRVDRIVPFDCQEKSMEKLTEQEAFYSHTNMNCYGDVSQAPEGSLPSLGREGVLDFPEEISRQMQVDMEALCAEAKARGIVILVAFTPSMVMATEEAPRERLIKSARQFREQLEQLPLAVLGHPENHLFPRQFFWDTSAHVNGQGRDVHTRLIAEALRHYLSMADGAPSGGVE